MNCPVLPKGTEADAGITVIETKESAAPVPVRDTVWGLLFALSLKLSLPDLVPDALGEKLTNAVQLTPAPRVAGLKGHVEVNTKSLTLLVIPVIVSGVD